MPKKQFPLTSRITNGAASWTNTRAGLRPKPSYPLQAIQTFLTIEIKPSHFIHGRGTGEADAALASMLWAEQKGKSCVLTRLKFFTAQKAPMQAMKQ
jgi:hypothetical protein